MSVRNLEALLAPASIAVIGASDRAQPRHVVMRNLQARASPARCGRWTIATAARAGLPAFADVASLPAAPDLAVVCTPARHRARR